jgi:hypothetical protein
MDSIPEPVKATEIRWTPEPAPRLEDIDAINLFDLDLDALTTYSCGLRDDLRAARTTLHAAIAALAAQVRINERQQATITRLIDQNRALRVSRRAA